MGQHNKQFKWFFQGLQIVSGNWHFCMNNKELTVIDVQKPNLKGANFSVEQVNQMFEMLGGYLCIHQAKNKQVFVNANWWTPAQGTVETVDNQIVNLPPSELLMCWVMATEVHSADLCTVIKCVYPLNGEQVSPEDNLLGIQVRIFCCFASSSRTRIA